MVRQAARDEMARRARPAPLDRRTQEEIDRAREAVARSDVRQERSMAALARAAALLARRQAALEREAAASVAAEVVRATKHGG
jgi:hypothetical protein